MIGRPGRVDNRNMGGSEGTEVGKHSQSFLQITFPFRGPRKLSALCLFVLRERWGRDECQGLRTLWLEQLLTGKYNFKKCQYFEEQNMFLILILDNKVLHILMGNMFSVLHQSVRRSPGTGWVWLGIQIGSNMSTLRCTMD